MELISEMLRKRTVQVVTELVSYLRGFEAVIVTLFFSKCFLAAKYYLIYLQKY